MESNGVEMKLFDGGDPARSEQDMPDQLLQLRMLEDALDYNGDPGVVVLLTGDGAGYREAAGFHTTLERMHKRGWRVEILSWGHSCNQRMRRSDGLFVALDDFYESITFIEPSRPGFGPRARSSRFGLVASADGVKLIRAARFSCWDTSRNHRRL